MAFDEIPNSAVLWFCLQAKIKKCPHGEDCPYCCWEWQGKTAGGYGIFYLGGVRFFVNRLVYEIWNKSVLGEKRSCHHCDNPGCANQFHLFKGTQQENILDAVRKKRWPQTKVTHCPKGHSYDAENTYIEPRGGRACKTCRRTHTKEWRERNRDYSYAI
jgi:hypothetical protein